jgi:hypothetical protein
MSTADEYIPDSIEYQTGKLYNGKPVFRRCASGTTSAGSTNTNNYTGITIPLSGTVLLCLATVVRGGQRFTMAMAENVACPFVDPNTGKFNFWVNNSGYANMQYVAWVEYTKS